jgi:hypothetical protein
MRRLQAGSKKRWGHELGVSLPWQVVKIRGFLQLVRPCPQLHPAGQFQADSKAARRQALAVDDPRLQAHALL